MINRTKQQAAFTLIELLLVITILSVVTGAIYTAHISSLRSWKFNRERIDLQQKGRIVVLTLAKDIRNATEISKGEDNFAEDDVITLAVDDEDSLEILLSNGDQIEYLFTDRKLKRDNRVLSEAVLEELTLEKEGNLIKMTLKFSHAKQEKEMTENVYPRVIGW